MKEFDNTPLYLAVKNQNVEIVQLLLTNEKLDVNRPYILSNYFT